MTQARVSMSDSRVAAALADLKQLIGGAYPGARFDVFEGDDPEGIYLRATVDIEDSSDAILPVLDKLYDLQVEHELPIYVVTSQPPERVITQLKARSGNPLPAPFDLPLSG